MDPQQLRCPTCGRITRWNQEPKGPFCSERCRLLDLGRWADETYRLSGDPTVDYEIIDPSTDPVRDG